MSVTTLTTTRIATTDELRQFATAWNCLAHGVPFRSFEWLSTWWEQFQGDRDLYVIAVRDACDQLLGAMPLFREQSAARGRILRLLGSGEVCSDYVTVLSTQEHEDDVVAVIASHLLSACSRSADDRDAWDLLELDGVSDSDPAIAKLTAALSDAGCGVHRKPGLNCWSVPLPNTWDEVYSSLSKNRRKALRRLKRDAFDNNKVVFKTANTDEDLDAAMKVFVDLHQKRRISLGEPGCFASEQFSEFLHSVTRRLWDLDAVELAWIELEGRAVAIEYNLIGADTAYSYQGGLDPEALDASPGHLLTMASIQHSIERGRKTYDFLRGDEPYKSHWHAEPNPTVTLQIAANTATAQLRQSVWLAGAKMKHWVKGGLTFTGLQ